MKPNGTKPSNGAEHSGSNGSAEPTVGEILAFLRGTLADAPPPGAEPPIKVPERTAGAAPDTFAAALAKAEAMATVAEPVAEVPAKEPASAPAPASEAQSTPLKPVNMPFKDSRFMRLAAAAPLPEIIAEAHPVSPAEALSSLSSMRTGPVANSGMPHWTAAAMAQAAPPVAANSTPLALQPPPVPANVPAVIDAEFNTVESAAAELLRPMLRQWLTNNMPRIVEKALRIELAEVPPGKKDT